MSTVFPLYTLLLVLPKVGRDKGLEAKFCLKGKRGIKGGQ